METLIITTQHADENNKAGKLLGTQLFHEPSKFLIVLQK